MMRFFKKAVSALLAGIIMTVSVFAASVGASAAQSSNAKLLSASLKSINSSAVSIESIGQDLYYLTLEDNTHVVYRIDSKVISDWKKTGKLTAKKIAMDVTISPFEWCIDRNNSFKYGDYAVALVTYKNNVTKKIAVKYEKAANKIVTYYKSDNDFSVSSKGYVAEFTYDTKSDDLNVRIKEPDLFNYNENFFAYKRAGGQYVHFARGSKYALVTRNQAIGMKVKASVYLVDEKAERYLIYDRTNVSNPIVGYNYIAFEHPPISSMDVRNTSTNKTVTLHKSLSFKDSKGRRFDLYDFGDRIYGDRAIGYFRSEVGIDKYEYLYALIDLKKDKIITGTLSELRTDDGKIFTGKTSSGTSLFFDTDGNKLSGTFSAAGVFMKNSGLAPVIKSGTLYLVDKNLKKASDIINVGSSSVQAATLSDDLYVYVSGGKAYLLTYRDGTSSSSSEKPGKTSLSVKKDGTSYTFSWKSVSGASEYEIFYSKDNGKTKTKLATASGKKTSCTITVKGGKNAKFAIRAVNNDGTVKHNGALSDWVSA